MSACVSCQHDQGDHDGVNGCTHAFGPTRCGCLDYRGLNPDPIDGTREGWKFCDDCQGIKPPSHMHGDPLEELTRAQLLARLRGTP